MSEKLRIAWLIQGDEGYGVRSATRCLTAELQARGVGVSLLSLAEGELAQEMRDEGFDVVRLSAGRVQGFHGSRRQKAIQFVRLVGQQRAVACEIAEVLKRLGADALHVQWPNLVGIAGGAARRAGVACFWEMPNCVGSGYPLAINRRWYQWQCWRNGIVPLANSAYTGSTLGAWPVTPITFHLAIDPARFDPARVQRVSRAELRIPAEATVLGIAARLDPTKGQDRILTAMLSLVAKGHDLHLVLLGGPSEGAYADALRATAATAGGADRLHLVGRVEAPERYYDLIDVAINSRVDAEPFGLSVVEAMMMARPVLVHALGGPTETVVDGETGWHVSDPSVASWEAGLRRALGDRQRWPQMRSAARQHALAHFTAQGQAERYLRIVEAVLATRGRAAAQ